MATVNIYEMAQTWNNGAVAFTAIGMNVTDTASDAASLLMDLQVGGASKFSVNKAGKVSTAGYFEASRGTSTGYYLFGSVFASQDTSNNRAIYLNGGQILGRTSAFYGGRLLIQSADHVVSIGDGANAQTFNIYNTYTDASNYERGFLKWNSNVLEIDTEAAGTGTRRHIRIAPTFGAGVGLASGNATAGYAVACGASVASSTYAFAAGGSTASGSGAMALGRAASASGANAIGLGYLSSASQANQFALGFSRFASSGDCQMSFFVLNASTTDATPTTMITSFGGSSKMVIPANTTWAFEITIAGRSDSGTDNAMYIKRGMIKRDGAGNTALIGSVSDVYTNETDANWDAAVTANDTNEVLEITVTGVAAANINWTATAKLTEVGNV